MAVALTRGALGLSVALMIGCAQGYEVAEVPDPRQSSPLPNEGGGNANAGMRAMSGGSGPSSGTGTPSVFQGEACMRGETQPCDCEGDMGEGIRSCRRDPDSPTEGTFSECEQCVPDEEPMAGSGGAGGAGGRGGSGASGSGGRAGSSGGGTAGRSSGGSAGTSGGSTGGSSQPWCIFVPIPIPGLCRS